MYNKNILYLIDFQKSPSSDFIWRGTSRDFVARGRPLRGQKRLAPLAKRGRLVASLCTQLYINSVISFVRVFNSYAVVNEYCTFKNQTPVNLFVW